MNMLKKNIRELSGHTLIYSLAWISSSAASIILMPIYTKFLSKEDYGILELLDYSNTVLVIVVIAGLNAAIPKFINDAKNLQERRNVISSAFIYVMAIGSFACLIAYLCSNELSIIILGNIKHKHLINLNIILLYLQLFVHVSGIGFIAYKKSKVYLFYMIIRLIFAIIFNLYFIVVANLGVTGMLAGNIIANGISGILLTSHSIMLNGLRIDFSILKKILRFGIPLIPSTLSATVMHNADRYIIRYYDTLDSVGIYSIGYKFPWMINTLILQAFGLVWSGAMMYEISKQNDAPYQFGKIATYVLGFYIMVQSVLSIFSVSIVRIFTDQKFWTASNVIPFVALGLSFHAYQFFLSTGAYLTEKTGRLNYAYIVAAIFNIGGNMILIPMFGYLAAAWVTVVTYFLFSMILYFSCRKLVQIEYEFRRLSLLLIGSIAAVLLSYLWNFDKLYMEIIKSSIVAVLYFSVLYFGSWFSAKEKYFIKEKIQSFF